MISAITKTNVAFTIPALSADTAAYTVEVLDNNGNKVEVNPVSLEKGETEVTLAFKTPFGVDPTGVWTVGGFKFDIDAANNFTAIVTAAGGTNQVTLLNALTKAGIKNVNSNNIAAYGTSITSSTTKETLSDIQKIVDDVNATSLTDADKAAAVKAVVDATNQVQLLSALQNKAFTRVNSDWIVDYFTTIKPAAPAAPAVTTASLISDVQTLIDNVNDAGITAAQSAANTAVTVASQNTVTDLITKYTVDDVAGVTTKALAIKASQVKAAVFGVKEATTAATVYNALVKLSSLDSTDLPATALNTNLKSNYLTAKNNATIDGSTTAAGLVAAVVTGTTGADVAASTSALSTIKGITGTTSTTDVKTDLQKLADVTSHLGTAKFDVSKVVDSRLADYRAELVAAIATAGSSPLTQVNVETAINKVNGDANASANIATLKDSTKTVAQVRDALTEIAAGAVTTAATSYVNASSQVKLEVAQFVVDNRSNLDANLSATIVTSDTGTTYALAPLKTALADHVAALGKFNALGTVGTATISATKGKLVTYAYAPYLALSTSQQLAVAEEINKLTKPTSATDSTPVSLNFTTTDAVKTLAQANAYIDAAIKTVLGK